MEGGYTVTNPFSTTNCWRACLVPLESRERHSEWFLTRAESWSCNRHGERPARSSRRGYGIPHDAFLPRK